MIPLQRMKTSNLNFSNIRVFFFANAIPKYDANEAI